MKRSKLESRRQAVLYPGLYRHKAVCRPYVGLFAFGFRGRAKVVTPQRTLRGSGVERFTGARAFVLVAEVGKTHLSHIGKVSREAIRANVR